MLRPCNLESTAGNWRLSHIETRSTRCDRRGHVSFAPPSWVARRGRVCSRVAEPKPRQWDGPLKLPARQSAFFKGFDNRFVRVAQ